MPVVVVTLPIEPVVSLTFDASTGVALAGWEPGPDGETPDHYVVTIDTVPAEAGPVATVTTSDLAVSIPLPLWGLYAATVVACTADGLASGPTTSGPSFRPLVEDSAPELARRGWTDLGFGFTTGRTDMLMLAFLTVFLQPMQPVADVAEDTPGVPGFSTALDPAVAPWWLLPWLAQWVGQTLPPWVMETLARDPSPARRYIIAHPGWQRGTVPYLYELVRTFLRPGAAVTIDDRVGNDPMVMSISVNRNDFAPPAGYADSWEQTLRAELEAAIPAWILWTLDAADGPTFDQVAAAAGTFDARRALFPTFDDVTAYSP